MAKSDSSSSSVHAEERNIDATLRIPSPLRSVSTCHEFISLIYRRRKCQITMFLTADNIGEYFAEGDELLKLGSFREIVTKRANRKTSKGKRKVRVGTVNKVRRDFTQAIHKTLKNHFNIELLKPLSQQLGKELYKDPQIAAGIIIIKRASVHILMDAGVPNVNKQKIESDVKDNLRCLLKPRSQKRQRPGNLLCSF
jgi:hypothetical protein